MAIVVLAVAAAGVLLPFANAAAVQAEGARQTMAANLASELMEKILTVDYDLILSLYETYSEPEGGLIDAAGNTHTDTVYAGFSRTAACQPAVVASKNLILITVTVYYDGGEMTRITTLTADHE